MHVTRAVCGKLLAGGRRILATLPVFGCVVRLTVFDVVACVHTHDMINEDDFVIVDEHFVNAHPAIRSLGEH